MGNGYKVTLGILTIMILLTLTVGTSYSYYSIGDVQDSPNILNTTCFNVTYNDRGSTFIKLPTAAPTSDDTAKTLTPYTFTITNTCEAGNANTNYVVTINTLTTPASNLPTTYLRYRLGQGTDPIGEPKAFPTDTYDLGASIKTQYGVVNSYRLATGTLEPGHSVTYNLRLWLSDINVNCTVNESGVSTCTPDVMGKTFAGKILVYNYI